ncbi:MAG: methionine--tRNA ligase [Parcubacteria group bacterium CG1_02_41_12]|nr:MAG: methionine--tRNA ligase [Parcubacteria group bacterium CG1_02_41_12]PIP67159.1 MAG: methionine--tRNA ligase [Parcubacteria group bacterium CG22_combo_CG10-13_8_21_14_all_41_9]PIQ80484.1 MAG: methionine--tRNA ligase [Parcubacteria group bacterium CG11_big_fil_rev_8_21_14_0_20_41_14]PIR56948.1 MAG: methionine--tRNA ligase [Parcubacteria group bacterium CG10_big_fil_rev_8_21_14_0_10_41_35]
MKFYITTPIYYVNAKPHIGHAYTTLAADVISRFQKSQGRDCFFLTGTDEHGAKVALSAKEAGKDPQKFTDEVAQEFKTAWKNLGIEYSDFIRTTETRHKERVKKFLENLKEKGILYEGEYKGLYCTGCENFITEKELVDNKCQNHKKEPEQVIEKNWFFKLSNYTKQIKELIESDKILIRPEFAKKEALGLLEQGLDDFSISREKVSWGVKLPWDENQSVYVWVDALLNYITAREYPNLKGKWPADLQLIGKDILKFHAIYWPAMLLAAELDPPKELFVHGYFTIDGQKMSKSLGNVIDPNDLVKDYGTDGARYLILSQFPFGQDGDVKADMFKEQYNSDLANGIGNLLSRASNLIEKNFDGEFEKKESSSVKRDFNVLMLEYKLYEALKSVISGFSELDKKIDQSKLWNLVKTDKEKAGKILSEIASEILVLAGELELFLPETAEKIIKQFTQKNIKKQEPMFPRK